MEKNIKKAVIEISSIVFAVLFALGVEAMYDRYQRQQEADEALVKIMNEIEYNITEFESQKEAIDSLLPDLAIVIQYLEKKTSSTNGVDLGFEQPTFQTTAWETAKLTDVIKDMEYEHVVIITKAYSELDFYSHLVEELISQFLTKDFHNVNERLHVIKAMYLITSNLKSNAHSTVSTMKKSYMQIKSSMEK